MSRPLLCLTATAWAAALLLSFGSTALAAGASAAGEPSLHEQLEAEKQVDNVYKAYFPSLDVARKAAISFHAQLLETDYKGGYLVMQLEPREIDQLRRFGFRFERAADFITRRNQALTRFQIAAAQRSAGTPEPSSIAGYACYETVEETFAASDALIAAKPTLASWVSAGSSWLKTQNAGGYDLKVLKITNSAVTPPDGASKPKLLINSAIHAREYTTAPLSLEFARWLLNGYGTNADATWIVDHHEVHLLLHTNPDGRKRAETGLSWRKNVNNAYCANTNTRGVDLNRNFTFQWNSTAGQGSSGAQCDLTYRGPAGGSEPETMALQDYVRSLWPDRRGPGLGDAAPSDTSGVHIDLHSYAQLVLWPWGTTSAPSGNAAALQTMGRRLAWFNGYTPQQSIGLYPTDGTSDGPSYGELGVAAFTIELGTAFFESCTSYTNTTRPANLPALIYAAKVARTPYITPGGPDVLAPALSNDASGAGVAAGVAVTLTASATDTRFNNSNGAEPTQAIAAAEVSIDVPPWQAGAATVALQASDGSFNSSTEALTGSISTAGLAPGKHIVYVRARDASTTWGPVSAVFLNISSVQPIAISELEYNNTLATAQGIPSLPALVSGFMSSSLRTERSDTDVFRVTVGAGRTLSAVLKPGPLANPDLQILDANGVVLASSVQGIGLVDNASATNSSAAPVTMYLRVLYGGGAKDGPDASYTLLISE